MSRLACPPQHATNVKELADETWTAPVSIVPGQGGDASLLMNREVGALHETPLRLSMMAEKREEMSAAQYTSEAMWSPESRAFIARVREFPSLEAHGVSRGSSIRALRSVITTVVKDLVDSGAEVPAQAAVKKRFQK
jgi:hypothetical protein